MTLWAWFLFFGKLAAAIQDQDEDGCNLQKPGDNLRIRAAAPEAASVLAALGSVPANSGPKAVLLETQQQFSTLEALLRHKKPEPQLAPAPAPADAGYVKDVYSFAAPPLTQGYQLLNGRQADGIFPGLRVWTVSPHGHFDLVSRASFWYRHPKIMSFEVNVGDAIGSITVGNYSSPLYSGSSTKVDPKVTDTAFLPRNDALPCLSVKKCHIDYYWQNYSAIGEPELDIFIRFATNTAELWPLDFSKRDAQQRGYRMIGRAVVPPRKVFFFDDHNDIIHLYQHEVSLECVLAIEGSDASSNDWFANLHGSTSKFCGFHKVHHGLGDKLRHQTRSLAWSLNIEAKLQSCAKVTVTGHSQGGGLAELFAACVNRDMLPNDVLGRADYAASSWTPSPPRLLDEVN